MEVQETKDHIVLKTNRLVANRWGKYGGGFVFGLVKQTAITALTYRPKRFSGRTFRAIKKMIKI